MWSGWVPSNPVLVTVKSWWRVSPHIGHGVGRGDVEIHADRSSVWYPEKKTGQSIDWLDIKFVRTLSWGPMRCHVERQKHRIKSDTLRHVLEQCVGHLRCCVGLSAGLVKRKLDEWSQSPHWDEGYWEYREDGWNRLENVMVLIINGAFKYWNQRLSKRFRGGDAAEK